MLYTIIGSFIGGTGCYIIAKIFNIEFEKNAGIIRLPGPGELLVIAGTIFGGGIGFGYGINAFANGAYF
jgi:hypothetical protein